MIPFFRKLRKQLADDNKPLKYLRYAIGEIVLVVIGILIALQINNWNQDRQLRHKEKKILIELKRDLVSNDSILQHEIKFQQNIANEITTTIEHLKSKKPYNDTISSYLIHMMWIERIQFVSSSYESLKSFGIDIITSDLLRSDIAKLFGNEFPFKTNWLRDGGMKYADLLLPYYVDYFEYTADPVQSKIDISDNPAHEVTRLAPDYENLLKSQKFINVISSKRAFKNAIVRSLKLLKDEVKNTITSIDNELETF